MEAAWGNLCLARRITKDINCNSSGLHEDKFQPSHVHPEALLASV
jgi:hypothetical protein